MMNRLLVTGATGFIGRHVLTKMQDCGFEVHATTRERSPLSQVENVCWHTVDLLNTDQVLNLLKKISPTHLLHLAWYAFPGKFWTAEENLSWVGATLELCRAFSQFGGKRAVLAGSCAEYAWNNEGACSERMTPCQPSTLYGTCKLATQKIVSSWFHQTGVSAAWGRVFFLYGPFENRTKLVSSVISSLLAEQPARCSSGKQVRDYMHVEDIAGAFASLLESDVTGVVNIGQGEPVSVKDIVSKIASLIGRPELLELDAIALKEDDPMVLYAETTRLRTEVGFHPRYNLQSGLQQTIEWHRLHGQVRG